MKKRITVKEIRKALGKLAKDTRKIDALIEDPGSLEKREAVNQTFWWGTHSTPDMNFQEGYLKGMCRGIRFVASELIWEIDDIDGKRS
jgi:hypothetical protein